MIFGELGYVEMGGTARNKCTFFDGGWMRGSFEVVGFGHGDGSSFDLGKTSHDLDEKHTIKRTICSGINTSALITRKNAINRVIAGKML